jgi:hypothetical protein
LVGSIGLDFHIIGENPSPRNPAGCDRFMAFWLRPGSGVLLDPLRTEFQSLAMAWDSSKSFAAKSSAP